MLEKRSTFLQFALKSPLFLFLPFRHHSLLKRCIRSEQNPPQSELSVGESDIISFLPLSLFRHRSLFRSNCNSRSEISKKEGLACVRKWSFAAVFACEREKRNGIIAFGKTEEKQLKGLFLLECGRELVLYTRKVWEKKTFYGCTKTMKNVTLLSKLVNACGIFC